MIEPPKFLGSKYIVKEFGGKACPYCGQPMTPGTDRHPTKDHVIPKSRGGTLEGDNCLVVCRRCNNSKADRTPTVTHPPHTASSAPTGSSE